MHFKMSTANCNRRRTHAVKDATAPENCGRAPRPHALPACSSPLSHPSSAGALAPRAKAHWGLMVEPRAAAPGQLPQTSAATSRAGGCAASCAPPPVAPSRPEPSRAQTQAAATARPGPLLRGVWRQRLGQGCGRRRARGQGCRRRAARGGASRPAESDRTRHHAANTLERTLASRPSGPCASAEAGRHPAPVPRRALLRGCCAPLRPASAAAGILLDAGRRAGRWHARKGSIGRPAGATKQPGAPGRAAADDASSSSSAKAKTGGAAVPGLCSLPPSPLSSPHAAAAAPDGAGFSCKVYTLGFKIGSLKKNR